MIDGSEHLRRILDLLPVLPPVEVPVADALGRVLAADVVSVLDLPGLDNSAMDGYAVRSADVARAGTTRPVRLTVLGDIAAGADGSAVLAEPGTTWRIMTGAPIPEGADAVVPVEQTDGGTTTVSVQASAELQAHVRRRGGDVRDGDVVLRVRGTVLSPGHLALAAAAGAATLTVRPAPRVAVLSTGDELVPVGQMPSPGQVVDSNSLMLATLVRAAGGEVVHQASVVDDAAAVREALDLAGEAADLVLSTGGVSMGAYDTVKEVLVAAGSVRFERVAMRPGMPQGAGVLEPSGTPIITLPGNPVSALVSFHVFVLPALRALAGAQVDAASWPDSLGTSVPTAATGPWPSFDGRVELSRVIVQAGYARRSGGQGSHMLGAMADATHLAIVPADRARVEDGDRLSCLPLLGVDLVPTLQALPVTMGGWSS